jgi:hypothetical protein
VLARHRQANDARFIFLVGGFAESKALEHRVKNELERDGRRVVVPLRPGLTVAPSLPPYRRSVCGDSDPQSDAPFKLPIIRVKLPGRSI